MPEHVKMDPEWGIVEVVAHHDVTIEQMQDSQKQIASAYPRDSIRGLLYDGRHITQAPSEGDLFAFAKHMVKSGQFQGIPFAVLTHEESALPHMFLTMTVNRLGQPVRVFSERRTALDWLRAASAGCQGDTG